MKNMKNMKIILIVSLFALISACTPKVYTINPSGNDLSNYKSFAYLPNTNVEVVGKNYSDTLVNRAIVEAVKLNLIEEGMELDRDEPDLLVLISTSTNIEVETETEPIYATYPYQYRSTVVNPYYGPYYYRGYPSYSGVVGYNTSTYSYKEGTVVIDLIDRKTKKTVWKGIASDEIYSQANNAAIREMVDDIFDEFPAEKNM